ncbi:MAG: helix-turn-helix domain-containing protein [Minisyncoccia bacterium]
MNPEETTLEIFLRDRMKERGVSLKKLSDMTGISMSYIENMLRGDFEHVPATPYFRGYLIRIGETLGFDGETWWEKIKKEEGVKKSGPADSLPKNRFVRESPAKLIAISIAVIAVICYLGFELPHILGKPALVVTFPMGNPYATSSNNVVIEGSTKNADSIYVNGDEATITTNGSWQKNVLLQSGINTFDISAKKFLGGKTDVMEQIVYNPSISSSSPSSTIATTTVQ